MKELRIDRCLNQLRTWRREEHQWRRRMIGGYERRNDRIEEALRGIH